VGTSDLHADRIRVIKPPMNTNPEVRPHLDFMQWENIDSLVGSISSRSLVARPTTVGQCREALAYFRQQGMKICARGAGRTYGDLALNDGQALIDMKLMNRIIEFDEEHKTIKVEAGTRLIDIFREVHYRLLTLPASPTESHSSVAGAICANVNGKDAWRRGSFGNQVVSMTLLLANGEILTIDRSHELFNAIIGGIGMLGIILDATLQLRSIKSPFVEINLIPAADVDAMLETMAEVQRTHDAAVVWVDAYARGKDIGRSVVHAASWIERDDTQEERQEYLNAGFDRLDKHRRFGLALHQTFGPVLSLMLHAQRLMMFSFNRLYYTMGRVLYRMGRASNTELFLRFSFEASFTVPPAQLVCGPLGYTLQVTFPYTDARAALIELLGICRSSPCPPVTTILRAHKRDDGLLSFSEDGYSLNFEFHPKKRHEVASREAIDRIIDATAKRGGKVHLAKDQVLTPEQFYRVYPRYKELLKIKQKLDPEGTFTSDLARRVGIDQVLTES
jgi:decaprenylphospho-beta-D-ribofuranose 2-oxidase